MMAISRNGTLLADGAVHAPLQHVGEAGDVPWWTVWELRPEVLIPLGLIGGLYLLGWWRLRRGGHASIASGWALAAHFLGQASLVLALLSGIDAYGALLFTMHMVQHEILMMVAPPLLLLARPMPILLWGLPRGARRRVGSLFGPAGRLRELLRLLLPAPVCFLLFVGTLWLWHTPEAYNLALLDPIAHDIEHLMFFGTSMLFWWQVLGTAPRVHGGHGFGLGRRLMLLLPAFVQNEALATLIALADRPIYRYYMGVPRIWGLDVMEDQRIGGAIMWIPGGMMYGLAAVLLIAYGLDRETKAQQRREGREASHSRLSTGPKTALGITR
jgi:putative membrane protein